MARIEARMEFPSSLQFNYIRFISLLRSCLLKLQCWAIGSAYLYRYVAIVYRQHRRLLCTYLHTYTRTNIHTYIHACIHADKHTCMHTCIDNYIHMYIYIDMCVYIYTHIRIYIYTHNICLYMYTFRAQFTCFYQHVHIRMHIHTHIHMHTFI